MSLAQNLVELGKTQLIVRCSLFRDKKIDGKIDYVEMNLLTMSPPSNPQSSGMLISLWYEYKMSSGDGCCLANRFSWNLNSTAILELSRILERQWEESWRSAALFTCAHWCDGQVFKTTAHPSLVVLANLHRIQGLFLEDISQDINNTNNVLLNTELFVLFRRRLDGLIRRAEEQIQLAIKVLS